MRITHKWIGVFTLGAACSTAAAPALAQNTLERPTGPGSAERTGQANPGAASQATTQTPSARQGANAQQAGSQLDQEIAVCLTLGNQEEIALAQFADQRSQNPEVKRFAQQMIEHHQQALAKIRQAAPETANLNLQLRSTGNGENAGNAQNAASQTGVRTASAEVDVVGRPGASASGQSSAQQASTQHASAQLAQRIKQECLNLTQQELAQKQGVEFDKAYMAQQVGAHVGMLAQLRGSKEFASDQLQQVIAEGEQMTERHLAEAKQIMGQIKDETGRSAPQTSQRQTTPGQPTR